MSHVVSLQAFEGPLDLLLQLIEADKLEITEVALAQVTESFVQNMRARQGQMPLDELADFLYVAARLVYLKSKAILPDLHDPSLEDEVDLADQLRAYQVFAAAAARIGERWQQAQPSYGRSQRPRQTQSSGFFPPSYASAGRLRECYAGVIRRLEPLRRLSRVALERVATLEEKIADLRACIGQRLRTSLQRVLVEARDRHDMVLIFLALLELLKQRQVCAIQGESFADIVLTCRENQE